MSQHQTRPLGLGLGLSSCRLGGCTVVLKTCTAVLPAHLSVQCVVDHEDSLTPGKSVSTIRKKTTAATLSDTHRALDTKRYISEKCLDSCASTVKIAWLIVCVPTVTTFAVINTTKCLKLDAMNQSAKQTL